MLTELGLEPVTLLGHSTGAHLAAVYAATRPTRVRALVLANPGPPLVPELRERFGAEMASRRPRELVEEMARLEASDEYARRDPETLERHYRLRYRPFFRDVDAALNVRYGFTSITAASVLEAAGRLMADFGDQDPAGSLGRISCPTLVVHSAADPIPAESSRLIADLIPGAYFVELENVGHFAFIEDPEAFAAAVEPFLREHATA